MSFGFGFALPHWQTLSGAAAAWTPADLGADLALWLDADDAGTIVLNGSTVSQWSDKSGNNRHAAQATAASQPAYQATGFASKPGIYFNGSTYLFNTSPFMYDAGSVSAFAAMRPDPTLINQFFLAEGFSESTSPIYAPLVNRATTDLNDQSFYYRSDATGGTSGALLFDDGMTPANRIVGLTDSGTQVTAYNNGTMGSSVAYARGVTTLNRFSIGGLLRATFGLGMPSTAGEIVVATGVLSTSDRQKLEGYLAWKWGLSYALPNDHPYKWDTSLFGGTDLSGFDADSKTYITSVETADKQDLETGVREAINDFVVGCKADGIWTAIKASCILAGARTLAGALQPLVGTAPTNFNFVSGDYNRETGLIGNGTTKYLDSNRNNDTDPQNSKHMAVYVGAAPTNTSALIGAREGVSLENGSSQLIHVNASSSSFRINSLASATSVNGIGIGLAGVSRTGASAVNWRHSSSFTGTDNAASQTPFSVNMHVFQRAGTSGNVPTNARMSFYSFGEAINLAQLDTRVSALMTAIDGAIP